MMIHLTPRRFVAFWGAGTLLAGLGTFWMVRMIASGELPGPGPDVLPPVHLNAEAREFVEGLPVLTEGGVSGGSATPARIVIPRLGVDSTIVELPLTGTGWFLDGLETHIGHMEGTDAPGGIGNTAFAGHIMLADGSPGPLAEIEFLLPGDSIVVMGVSGRYEYQVVDQQMVGEDRLEVVYPTDTPMLTLITCARWSWLNGRYINRQVVTARLVNSAPTP